MTSGEFAELVDLDPDAERVGRGYQVACFAVGRHDSGKILGFRTAELDSDVDPKLASDFEPGEEEGEEEDE